MNLFAKKHDRSVFVSKHYIMNPDSEDLLRNGMSLAEGMVVLVENDDNRVDVDDDSFLSGTHNSIGILQKQALKYNRWCKVTNLFHSRISTDIQKQYVSFIGVYEDKTKFLMLHSMANAWYVKVESIPAKVVYPKFIDPPSIWTDPTPTINPVLIDDPILFDDYNRNTSRMPKEFSSNHPVNVWEKPLRDSA